jgi:hypothetical protein
MLRHETIETHFTVAIMLRHETVETNCTFVQKLQHHSIKSAQKQKGNKCCKYFIPCVQLWPEYESKSFIV